MGDDVNINVLQPSSSQHEFETPLLSNDFGQQLKIAMCMTTNTQTSLDVFTSDEIITGVLESSISDHLVTIFMFSKKPTHQRKRESNLNVKIQDINSSSLEAFRSSNAAINWDKVRQPGNPDEAYEEFLGLFRKAYSQSFPLVNVRKPTKACKPYISNECLRMIKRNNKLYRTFLKTRKIADW